MALLVIWIILALCIIRIWILQLKEDYTKKLDELLYLIDRLKRKL